MFWHMIEHLETLDQTLKRELPVALLRAPLSRHDRDPGRYVSQSNPGLTFIAVLSTWSTPFEKLKLNFILQDL